MKLLKILFIIIIGASVVSFTIHKYYVSTTTVEYVKEKQSLQIISEIILDDLEQSLQERYDKEVKFSRKNEDKEVQTYLEDYLKDKISIKINDKLVALNFIGKEYDNEHITCYLEVQNLSKINQLEISNKLLFESFEKQQNIVKIKVNGSNKTFNLIDQNNKAVLNF